MRIFPFPIVIALSIEALAGTGITRLVTRSLADFERSAPAFSGLFFGNVWLLWLVPIASVFYALVISIKRECSINCLLIFAGTAAIAAALLFGIILIAAILPLLNFKG